MDDEYYLPDDDHWADDDGMIELNRAYSEYLGKKTASILSYYGEDDLAELIYHIGMFDMEKLGGGDKIRGATLACAAQLTLITYLCLEEF